MRRPVLAVLAVLGVCLTTAAPAVAVPSGATAATWTYHYATPPGAAAEARGVVGPVSLGEAGSVPLVCNVDSGAPHAPTDDPDRPVLFAGGRWLLTDIDGQRTTSFGRPGDVPLCLRDSVNPEGRTPQDRLVVKRGSTYHMARSYAAGGGGVDSFTVGRATDVPLVGDWDGDGVETLALRRGNRYFFTSANVDGGGTVVSSTFGSVGDDAVAGFFVGARETIAVRRGNVIHPAVDAPGRDVLRGGKPFGFGRASDVLLSGNLALGDPQVVAARPS